MHAHEVADTLAKIEVDTEMAVKVADKKVIKNYLGVKMWSRACLTEGKGDGGDKVAVGSVTKIKSFKCFLSNNFVQKLFPLKCFQRACLQSV